ncbi:hypothetical protein [Spirosoma linguale]|uniref:Uncharacterized protein n=1 Tax=Spirosoma linguale (strain ATCC 33905 / DSM 74 / LMG 10896 / Claus 1) TaxID=504472 RepID=D2QEP4_SPILD|nr:hypothetical protein Slin_2275 [Spirosoma linguale DSM 74]
MKRKMILVLIVGGTVLLLVGIIMNLFTEEYKPMYTVAAVSIIGAILVLVGGIARLNQDISSAKRNLSIQKTGEKTNAVVTTLQEKNDTLIEMNMSLTSQVQSQVKTIEKLREENFEFRKENFELNTKLTGLTTKTFDEITAKDSYCYLTINLPLSPIFNKAAVVLHHIGPHTLKNVQIALINSDEDFEVTYDNTANAANTGVLGLDEQSKKYYKFMYPFSTIIPVIPPGREPIQIGNIDVTHRDPKSFNVYFRADNGATWYQRIILRREATYSSEDGANLPSNFTPRPYFSATQLYKIRERTPDERLIDRATANARVEVLIKEGASSRNHLFDPREKDAVKWGGFPKLKGEITPFSDRHKLHWKGPRIDGTESAIAPIIFEQVITEYDGPVF